MRATASTVLLPAGLPPIVVNGPIAMWTCLPKRFPTLCVGGVCCAQWLMPWGLRAIRVLDQLLSIRH